MPNKTYRLYPKAIEDLESIYLYSIREFGIKRTEDYILAIQTSFQYLTDDPLISRTCDYVRQDLRAFNVGSHVIFFKMTHYGIAVIRVLHQSMDFSRHL
ncbi:TPA: type II toxin-antitoxin system RelE/ParE family toxin [Legionella pneumophila]|jgi:toxin ParE1/3/4|nr:type II toxin-antitoxin system RelE/ParE family toxin [Legionella pneumophila]HAU1484767.1 type II toxin-antitoxin system RelE/ParE family toxin [Legionella pneumophila]HAU1500615.1 type II toxin-antitoxin system RelE/ParE family toxin [Legionella pneumophila]HAU1519500.1 type II toxin-antitoxin system RelE/ParE family toxin [Legionella pneumophila]HCL6941407.1 type II toxin-antitoxin system RelE/ParE family toxin [Legionella pneumophila]